MLKKKKYAFYHLRKTAFFIECANVMLKHTLMTQTNHLLRLDMT